MGIRSALASGVAIVAMLLGTASLAAPALAQSGGHRIARTSDTVGVLCTYVNVHLCIRTNGTGNRVTLDTQANDTLFDFQPATGSGNYKIKIFNSTHCLTVSANDFVLSDTCQQGDGDQVWHRNDTGASRTTWNIQGTNPLFLEVRDPPFNGQDVQAFFQGPNEDSGWFAP